MVQLAEANTPLLAVIEIWKETKAKELKKNWNIQDCTKLFMVLHIWGKMNYFTQLDRQPQAADTIIAFHCIKNVMRVLMHAHTQ